MSARADCKRAESRMRQDDQVHPHSIELESPASRSQSQESQEPGTGTRATSEPGTRKEQYNLITYNALD